MKFTQSPQGNRIHDRRLTPRPAGRGVMAGNEAGERRTNRMKTTITQSMFIDAFRDCGRESQFSYAGLCALFEYLDDLDEQCGTETELDPIAICCDFSEAGRAVHA